MRSLYDVAAPAKLNLFLHVTGRRPDGYHLLQSAFMLIDWCDALHFDLRQDGELSREDLSIALPKDDLILRAARALKQLTGSRLGAHIDVQKNIPSQAGLGGGSSDAASTLLALNRLWGLGIDQPTLAQIGASLGADVPFFLLGKNAWVQGIGDIMEPIDLPTTRWIVIKPPQGLETAKIFSSPTLQRNTQPATMPGFAADPLCYGRNDLQSVAEGLCPQVSEALQMLSHWGLRGRMTGSGSSVFAQAPADDAKLQHWIVPEDWQMRVCGSLDVHPLDGWALG